VSVLTGIMKVWIALFILFTILHLYFPIKRVKLGYQFADILRAVHWYPSNHMGQQLGNIVQ